ncbi:hypothetical protein HER21_34320 [Pseudomonas sp. BGM005]|nr:hypothetical protein [Pseudomonas sp. BG5]
MQRTFASDVAVTVTDMSGNAELVESEDGEVTVTLGPSPVFITPEAE